MFLAVAILAVFCDPVWRIILAGHTCYAQQKEGLVTGGIRGGETQS